MFKLSLLATSVAAAIGLVSAAASAQTYTWKNVKIGGGGGFVPNIIFNPSKKGLAYARTDIGGAYRLNSDDTWTPLLDWVDNARWDQWGCDALATDPVDTNRLYLATGMYTNSWDPNNGNILISTDQGATWTASPLSFKIGGNMPGRGMGERLAVDPKLNSVLYFGARSGNGLWKSTNYGSTWAKVTSFPSVGTYAPDPTDTTGYNNDLSGLSWVTFDSTTGTTGTATPRIFVGVANKGANNVFVSNDAGVTWAAVAGQNNTYIPHKGVLSPSEKCLYVTYSDGAGPYDGTAGAVMRYNISTSVWTDITPAGAYYGFGGFAVDLLKPGVVMVAGLNSWWPDGIIFRSNNSGATWSPLWSWESYPTIDKWYKFDDSLAPWLGPDYTVTTLGTLQIGWMMEGLSIDPFDSNHWLYGTGATIMGGHDLLNWDTSHNVTLKSLADGIEETAILGLISPPSGPSLISAVGDVEGFVHTSLTTSPLTSFTTPVWSTTADIDFAGLAPTNLVRIGTTSSTTVLQVAISTDSGASWNTDYGAAYSTYGGKVALSASGDTVLWSSGTSGVLVSQYTNAFTAVSTLPSGAAIASDKLVNTVFYGASGSSFYLSTDGGKTFAVKSTLGASTAPVKIVVNLGVTGDVWVSTDTGLYHTTNSGTSFTAISGFTQAWPIALGAPKTTGGYPAIFAGGIYLGVAGYFRSDDQGANWVQINDATHGFGAISANVIAGDPRIYGRVYIGTNGRGIFYGDASGTAPASTTTVASTSASSTSSTSSTSKVSSSTSSTSSKSTSTSSTSSTSKSSSTVSSTSKTSSSTSSSASATSTAVAAAYAQCGGSGWTGATTCVSGYTCTYSNPFYSQCIAS